MTATASPRPRTPIDPRRRLTYRGVKLQGLAAPSRFTIDQIKKAVEDAIAENADTLAAIR